jgi:hypothetical protein
MSLQCKRFFVGSIECDTKIQEQAVNHDEVAGGAWNFRYSREWQWSNLWWKVHAGATALGSWHAQAVWLWLGSQPGTWRSSGTVRYGRRQRRGRTCGIVPSWIVGSDNIANKKGELAVLHFIMLAFFRSKKDFHVSHRHAFSSWEHGT